MATGDWVTYYETATGAIRGCGTVPPAVIDPAWTTINHGTLRPDIGNRWDPATRSWVAIPPEVLVDRLQDLAQHPYLSNVWSRLTAAQRTQLRRAMVWLLGGKRYRQQAEDIAIDAPGDWPTDPANVTE